MRLSMDIRFRHPVTVFSLVPGGWFPLAMTSAGIHLVDRNILIWLRNARNVPGGAAQQKRHDAIRWWLGFLDAPGQKINPVLCAMEGRHRRIPTLAEFRNEYTDACDEIQAYFPQATVLRHEDASFPAVYEMVSATIARHEREADFLCTVAPHIRERKSGRALADARDRILREAGDRSFRTSLVLLAVLSCLYEGPTPDTAVAARRVLKPKATYTLKQAHNALADIRSLEMLAAGFPLGGEPIGLCTGDRPLAAFWCHLGIRHSRWNGNACTVTYGFSPRLFPALPHRQQSELVELLAERGFVDRA